MKIHIVQKGDTLWKIAKKYGVNFEELKKMNSQLSNPDMIMPGMKVKVPTTGGHVKKEGPTGHNPGIKKEMPIAEHPYAKEHPKPMPIVEAPIKEVPIKEAPKAPYVPKMPTPVIPEIDINNYYMMNMQSMTVQPPPQPQVKEVPKKEVPVAPPPPVVEAPAPPPVVECPPVEMPVCEPECVPVTPVMPGPGFCPPLGYPMGGGMPLPAAGSMPMMDPGMASYAPVPMTMMDPGMASYAPAPMPMMDPGMASHAPAPAVGGAGFMPVHFEDESSSSFMPTMPMMNPGGPAAAQVPQTGFPVQTPYVQHGGFGGPVPTGGYQPVPGQGYPMPEYPAGAYQGYPEAPGGYPGGVYHGFPQGGYPGAGFPQMHEGYPGTAQPGYPAGAYPGTSQPMYPTGAYPGYPGEFPAQQFPAQQFPRNVQVDPAMDSGYNAQTGYYPYGQMPYGYPQMGSAQHANFETPDMYTQGAAIQQPQFAQTGSLPVSTGGLADCGCGTPSPVPQTFVPPTPPVYMAPYAAPSQFAQPPFMNPYGMEPMDTAPYGMPRDADDSDENGN